MTPRRITKRGKQLLAGIACGICCAACVAFYLFSVNDQARAREAEVLAEYGGSQVQVCVAKRDIAAGETIGLSDIEMQTWVASLLPDGAVTDTSQAEGQQVGSSILAGEVISSRRFGLESADIEVPEGYTAVCVPAEDIEAVGGALKSGMRVDVYATGSSGTSRLASSVLVIATSKTQDSAVSAATTWVTLAILPSRVQEIVRAAETLEIYFTLPSDAGSEGNAESSSSVAADENSDATTANSSVSSESGRGTDTTTTSEDTLDGEDSSSSSTSTASSASASASPARADAEAEG